MQLQYSALCTSAGWELNQLQRRLLTTVMLLLLLLPLLLQVVSTHRLRECV
jgi:hypothetical protein